MTTRELIDTFTREEGIALFNEKKTDKEVYDILVKKGLTDSYETFVSESQKIFDEKVSKMSKEEILSQIEGAELTDEQLEQIAGGVKSTGETVGMATGIGIGVSAIGIAANILIYAVTASTTAAAGAF